MRYKFLALASLLIFLGTSLVGCESEKDLEPDAPLSGKWEYAIPEDDWSITYEFKSSNQLKVTEKEESYKVQAEGKWYLDDDNLTIKIDWGGKGDDYDTYKYDIISRTTKTMVVYSYDERNEQTWKKK